MKAKLIKLWLAEAGWLRGSSPCVLTYIHWASTSTCPYTLSLPHLSSLCLAYSFHHTINRLPLARRQNLPLSLCLSPLFKSILSCKSAPLNTLEKGEAYSTNEAAAPVVFVLLWRAGASAGNPAYGLFSAALKHNCSLLTQNFYYTHYVNASLCVCHIFTTTPRKTNQRGIIKAVCNHYSKEPMCTRTLTLNSNKETKQLIRGRHGRLLHSEVTSDITLIKNRKAELDFFALYFETESGEIAEMPSTGGTWEKFQRKYCMHVWGHKLKWVKLCVCVFGFVNAFTWEQIWLQGLWPAAMHKQVW